jgi:hypothetical protein
MEHQVLPAAATPAPNKAARAKAAPRKSRKA